MRKLGLLLTFIFTFALFAAAAPVAKTPAKTPAPEAKKEARQEKITAFKKQFQEKREANIAVNKTLYDKYSAAKTDADKKTVEEQIKTQAAKEVDEGFAMTKQGISAYEENLDKAKEKQAAAEKNRDKIIEKRVEDIKAGKFNNRAAPPAADAKNKKPENANAAKLKKK